ncbi:MAG: hypothetical protein U0235_07640 [Polyangiaceae bacterium]
MAEAFGPAMEKAVEMTKYLESGAAFAARHDELEAFIAKDGQELLRRMLQGHHDLARSRSARFESKAPTAWCAHFGARARGPW